jgi:thioredoxin 1
MLMNQINDSSRVGGWRRLATAIFRNPVHSGAASVLFCALAGTGFGGEPGANKVTPPDGNVAVAPAVLKSSSTELKQQPVSPENLMGKEEAEVESALGKPSGKLQSNQGATWLYSDWRVQFDQAGKVARVEKDQPVRLAKVDPRFLAAADAVAKAQAARAAADDAARIKAAAPPVEDIRIVSNGGAELDLTPLLADDKITIVDFYADWCVPCQRMSPRLEQLAKEDHDVVLLKVDIVNWNTPVTAQFDIHSIPNVRVFNRGKTQVGDPTYDADAVVNLIRQAKGS